jgi:hypothetical protein
VLGLCAWFGPLLYIFLPFSHGGNQIEKIWWSFGILEGTFAWFCRGWFGGKLVPQLTKSYLTLILGAICIASGFSLARASGVTAFAPWLRDGGCLPVGLDTPVAVLQFEVENAFTAVPTLVILGLVTSCVVDPSQRSKHTDFA